LERSQFRKIANSLTVLSYLTVVDAPQDVQRHLWAPELVLPLRFVLPPHVGHMILFMRRLNHCGYKEAIHGHLPAVSSENRTHILADLGKPAVIYNGEFIRSLPAAI
jgi:hypothetical protein